MSQFAAERVPLTEVSEFNESSPTDDGIVAERMLLTLIHGEHPLRDRHDNVVATNFQKYLTCTCHSTHQLGGTAKMRVNLIIYHQTAVVAGIIDTSSAGGVSHLNPEKSAIKA